MRNRKVVLSVVGGILFAAAVVLFALKAEESATQDTSRAKEGDSETPLYV